MTHGSNVINSWSKMKAAVQTLDSKMDSLNSNIEKERDSGEKEIVERDVSG